MPRVSIVIPVYDNWDGCHQLLSDINQNCKSVFEVVLVDDESPDPSVVKGLSFWKKMKLLPIRVITNKSNLGFTMTSNIGLQEAAGDIKALISTDVRIHSRYVIDSLRGLLELNRRTLIGGTVYTHDTGWNKFGNVIVPYAEGYFLATTSYGWDELGYFDERYSPGDFEDVDLSLHAVSIGYELSQLPHNTVKHTGGGSFGYTKEREARTYKNRDLFKTKWSLNE